MKLYKIGEVAKKLNISKDTIRYYEKIGLINESRRNTNKYREYTEKNIKEIQCIILWKSNGFTLNEIRDLSKLLASEKDNNEIISNFINMKINEIDKKIDELLYLKKQLKTIIEKKDYRDCKK